jgi:hypothetical protein
MNYEHEIPVSQEFILRSNYPDVVDDSKFIQEHTKLPIVLARIIRAYHMPCGFLFMKSQECNTYAGIYGNSSNIPEDPAEFNYVLHANMSFSLIYDTLFRHSWEQLTSRQLGIIDITYMMPHNVIAYDKFDKNFKHENLGICIKNSWDRIYYMFIPYTVELQIQKINPTMF